MQGIGSNYTPKAVAMGGAPFRFNSSKPFQIHFRHFMAVLQTLVRRATSDSSNRRAMTMNPGPARPGWNDAWRVQAAASPESVMADQQHPDNSHVFSIRDNLFFQRKTKKPELYESLICQSLEKKSFFGKERRGEQLDFLDVGCGSGELSLLLMDFFSRKKSMNAVLLDPLPEALSITKARAKRWENLRGSKANLSFPLDTFERFSSYDQHKYDFILISQSLYYIRGWSEAVQSALRMLNRGGLICIALKANDQVPVFGLKNEVCDVLGVRRSLNPESAEDLETILLRDKITYTSTDFRYNVAFPESRTSPDGISKDLVRVLRFIWHFPLQRHLGNPTVWSMLKNFITEHKRGGDLTIPLRDIFFWIPAE